MTSHNSGCRLSCQMKKRNPALAGLRHVRSQQHGNATAWWLHYQMPAFLVLVSRAGRTYVGGARYLEYLAGVINKGHILLCKSLEQH